jgi:hypothetical protein
LKIWEGDEPCLNWEGRSETPSGIRTLKLILVMPFGEEEKLEIDFRKGSSIWFGKVLEKFGNAMNPI